MLATQPGYSDDVRYVDVVPDLEASFSTPFVLGQPCELTVSIDPPIGPDGQPWQVEIRDTAGPDTTFVRARGVAYAGRFQWRGLRSGHTYWIGLKSSRGLPWSEDDESFVARAPSVTKHIAAQVEKATGRVFLGGQPLSAHLMFGLRSNVKVEVVSKADGSFEGYLPRLGQWRVHVSAERERIDRDILVEVIRGTTDILLDTLELQGVLVDEREELFTQNSTLLILDESGARESHRAEEGRFSIRGLKPGDYTIYGSSNAFQSDAVHATVERDRESDQVRIVMKQKRALKLRVIEPGGGPAPRYPVLIDVGDPVQQVQGARIRYTEADGRLVFTEISAGETERCLALFSPVRPEIPAKILRVPIGPDEVSVQLETIGGVIETSTGTAVTEEPWLLRDGCPVRQSYFRRGGLTSLPRFVPGTYALCPGPTWNDNPSCARGVLEPLKKLVLRLHGTPASTK